MSADSNRSSSMLAVVLTALVLSAAACARPPDRPSVDGWRPTWDRATGLVDAASDGVPDREACERVLGELRVLRDEAIPGPDELVDEEVSAWFAEAEHLFFACPDGDDEYTRLRGDLARRQEQVAAALDGASG